VHAMGLGSMLAAVSSPPPIRGLVRRMIPFPVRVGLRRAPAVARHLVGRRVVRTEDRSAWAHLQCARSTPLRRQSTAYAEPVQLAKEHNVRRAVELVDGVVVAPGAVFSWHDTVGPPLRLRGFVPGPELHEGELSLGPGGGLCQVANLVFWLGLHSGMEVVERHRHGLDLFPDEDRTAPFGCGATVFYPHRDLRLVNPLEQPVLIALRVGGGRLHGEARLARDPGVCWEVVQTRHRFVRRDGKVWRENRVARRRVAAGVVAVEPLLENRAQVVYPVPESWLEPDRGGVR